VRWYPSCIPSDPVSTLCGVMYTARLVCSDPGCAGEVTADTATLRELETLLCDCGCALEIVGWPDVAAEPLAQVIMLRVAAGRRRHVPEAA
jgi:hypothetical protein